MQLTILSIAYCVLFLMSVFLIGLYVMANRDVQDMKRTIHFLLNENKDIRAKLRVHEKRFMKMSEPDKIVIKHEYSSEEEDLKFGGKGI